MTVKKARIKSGEMRKKLKKYGGYYQKIIALKKEKAG